MVFCAVFIAAFDLSDEQTSVLLLAYGNNMLLVGVSSRPAVLVVAHSKAKIGATTTMIELILASVSMCVTVTSTLSAIISVEELSKNCSSCRGSLCAQGKVKIRYQSLLNPLAFSTLTCMYLHSSHQLKDCRKRFHRYGWLSVSQTTVRACPSKVLLKKPFKTFPCSMPWWRE